MPINFYPIISSKIQYKEIFRICPFVFINQILTDYKFSIYN